MGTDVQSRLPVSEMLFALEDLNEIGERSQSTWRRIEFRGPRSRIAIEPNRPQSGAHCADNIRPRIVANV
jgi:hypothetical protein